MCIWNEKEFTPYNIAKPSAFVSGGPDWVVTDQPDPEFKPTHVGFVLPKEDQ